jgi:hypothetical protein
MAVILLRILSPIVTAIACNAGSLVLNHLSFLYAHGASGLLI